MDEREQVDTGDLGEVEQEVRQAEQDAADAEALVAAMEESIRDGGNADAEEYEQRRSLARFAELRVEAVRNRIARLRADAAERERRRVAEEVLAAVGEHDVDAIADRWNQARDALCSLVEAVNGRESAIRAAINRLQDIGLCGAEAPVPGWEDTRLHDGGNEPQYVILRGEELRPPVAGDVVRRLVREVAGSYGGLPVRRRGPLARVVDGPPRCTDEIEQRAEQIRNGGQR